MSRHEDLDEELFKLKRLAKSLLNPELTHPDEDALFNYVDDLLEPVERARIEEHSLECDDCRRQILALRSLQAIARERSSLNLYPDSPSDAETERRSDSPSENPAIRRTKANTPFVAWRSEWPKELTIRDAGGAMTLDSSGLIRWDRPVPSEARSLATAMISRERLARRTAYGKSAGALMGAEDPKAESGRLISPVATTARQNPPTFRWKGIEGGYDAVVILYDDAYEEILRSPRLTGADAWTPSAPLPAGQILVWEVIFLDGEDEIDHYPRLSQQEARFASLTPEALLSVERAEQEFKDSFLLKAAHYRDLDLIDEADLALESLERLNPEAFTIEIIRQIRRSLR